MKCRISCSTESLGHPHLWNRKAGAIPSERNPPRCPALPSPGEPTDWPQTNCILKQKRKVLVIWREILKINFHKSSDWCKRDNAHSSVSLGSRCSRKSGALRAQECVFHTCFQNSKLGNGVAFFPALFSKGREGNKFVNQRLDK